MANTDTASPKHRGFQQKTTLILATHDGLCPKPGTLFSGAIERVEPGRHQRALAEHGLRAASLWELSTVRTKKEALGLTALLLFVGACVQFLGFFGYLRRNADQRVSARRNPPLSHEQLLRQLGQAPLQLRGTFVLTQFAVPLILLVTCAGLGILMIWVPVTELKELRAERQRWGRATETLTVGPPAIELKHRVLSTPLMADVTVTWRAAAAPETPASAKYSVLWYSEIEPPYLVKHDALGTLTSVGLRLLLERAGSDLSILLMGLAFLLGSAYYARKLVRRQRAFRAVTASPRAMFRPLQKTEVLRHNGIATGQLAYTFLAPSGESIEQQLSKPRVPVFDQDGTAVLVVTAFDDPGAEPILVADDGYPFETRSR